MKEYVLKVEAKLQEYIPKADLPMIIQSIDEQVDGKLELKLSIEDFNEAL